MPVPGYQRVWFIGAPGVLKRPLIGLPSIWSITGHAGGDLYKAVLGYIRYRQKWLRNDHTVQQDKRTDRRADFYLPYKNRAKIEKMYKIQHKLYEVW